MRSPGFRSSGSTSPISGRKIVCLVEVLMTADFPTLVASRSMLAPSSDDSAVGSRSSSSTTLPTRYGSCRLFWIFSRFSLIFSFMVAFSCCNRWNSDFMILASFSRSRLRFRMSWVLSDRISSSMTFSSSASFISASPSPEGLSFPSPLSSLPSFLSLSSRSRRSRSSSSSRDAMVATGDGVRVDGFRLEGSNGGQRKSWLGGIVDWWLEIGKGGNARALEKALALRGWTWEVGDGQLRSWKPAA